MDPGQLQRIQTIGDLMRRAKSAAQENTESANGVAISLLHDAIEHTLYFILLDSHQSPKPREEFKALSAAVAGLYQTKIGREMPFQRQLADLNNHRVAFKHRGTRPTRSTTLEVESYGTEFVRMLFEALYGFKIEDFHPIEIVRIEALRTPLKNARDLFESDKIDDAMSQLALANYRVGEAFSALFGPPRAPLRISSPFGDDSGFRRELLDYITRSDEHTLVTAVLIASGQDVAGYTSMKWRLPVVHAFVGGSFRYEKLTPNPYTTDDVIFCIDQIARIAIWVEERFPVLDFKDGRWHTGAISPWAH